MLDGGAPHGMHYYWKSHRIPDLSDEVIDRLVRCVEDITSPFSQIGGWAVGGAASRVAPAATAVGDRGIGFELNVTGAWQPNDAEPQRHIDWVRNGWEALRPFGTGVYPNFLSDEGAAGVHVAYGDGFERLVAIKNRWDPDNVFRCNANIPPGEGSAT
jgi:hypothetical protein